MNLSMIEGIYAAKNLRLARCFQSACLLFEHPVRYHNFYATIE